MDIKSRRSAARTLDLAFHFMQPDDALALLLVPLLHGGHGLGLGLLVVVLEVVVHGPDADVALGLPPDVGVGQGAGVVVVALALVVAQLAVDEVAEGARVVGEIVLLEQVHEGVEVQRHRVVLYIDNGVGFFLL